MIEIQLPFSFEPRKLNKMKFWQTKKKLNISETVQVYKVIYLGNLITTWAKGENTLEKPLTVLWRNYCNNYANFYSKNNKKIPQIKHKQIIMKLTICNQGLKAITREFGLTEYWANRITFCGQNSNFPHVFVWIYRHEGKKMKKELRVHACLVNKKVNVSKMVNTLQTKLNFALDEYKREKKLRENSRKIMYINNNINLDEITENQNENESDIFSDDFVDYKVQNIIKDNEFLLDSNEKYYKNTIKPFKDLTLDSKRKFKNCSLTSLNSFASKSSNSSVKSLNYNTNLMPLRKQFLLKGMRNYKEPLERTRSAPKLSSIMEEYSSEEELEEEDDDDFYNNIFKKNIKNYFNSCEEENFDEMFCELKLLNDDVSCEFNKENESNIFFEENQFINLSPEPNLPKVDKKKNLDFTLINPPSSVNISDIEKIENDIKFLKLNQNNKVLNNENSLEVFKIPQFILFEKKSFKNNLHYQTSKNYLNDKLCDENEVDYRTNQDKFKNTNLLNNDLYNKKIIENCQLIEDLVLNF